MAELEQCFPFSGGIGVALALWQFRQLWRLTGTMAVVAVGLGAAASMAAAVLHLCRNS